jgi:uncharacterized protein
VDISVEGGRVLGSLVEKELTTPQQYPLTLSSLSSACNQTTNRQPVMALDDRVVERALDALKALGLVRFVLPSHGRSVTRYRHVLAEAYGLDVQRVALLALLLLRGPQTAGELRARAERMVEFDSIGAVNHELEVLAGQPDPLVRLLHRRPGQKEDRWQQLLAAESNGAGPSDQEDHGPYPDRSGGTDRDDLVHRVELLEGRVTELGDEVSRLSESFARLRRGLGDEDP